MYLRDWRPMQDITAENRNYHHPKTSRIRHFRKGQRPLEGSNRTSYRYLHRPDFACSWEGRSFPGGASGKVPTAKAGDVRDMGSTWKILCRRTRQPTPVFSPGESQGQRGLAGYSPEGHKESDTTKWLSKACERQKGEREKKNSEFN